MNQEDLEHFEKIGFLYPVLRLHRPKIDESGGQRYAGINESAYEFKRYLESGMLEFPSPANFRPWREYRDGYEEKTIAYYHPYQVILIGRFFNLSRFVLTSRFLESVTEFEKPLISMKESLEDIKKVFLDVRPQLVMKIGLLLQLQNAYQPLYRSRFHLNPFDSKSFEKWLRWKKEEFSPQDLLKESGFTINEVKNWRDFLAVIAISKDPLEKWYSLVRLVSFHKREKLKGKALLAQDYYEMAGMLNYFLEDLSGEKQPEPDDIVDGRMGLWKEDYYGKKFDYEDIEIQRKIIEEYLKAPLPGARVVVLVEGDTENISIPILASAMGFSIEKEGIILHNFEGIGGITVLNVKPLLQVAKPEGVGRYLIIDNDEDAKELVEELVRRRRLLDDKCYRVWTNDFEEDNFGRDLVLETVNEKIIDAGFNRISKNELDEEMSRHRRKKLMKALADIFYKKYQHDLDQLISKIDLGRILSIKRAVEIRKEISAEKYSPKWGIEEEIIKIYNLFCR